MRIDSDDAHTKPKINVVALIPVETVENDILIRFFTCQHRRQQDAVVVDVSLVAEDRDVELRRVPHNLLDASHSRHPISDDHKLFH